MLYELIEPGTIIALAFIAGAVTTLFFTALIIEHQEDKNNVSENR